MERFVKQGSFGGYRDVPGGISDPECEYVIMSKQDYLRLYRDKSNAESGINEAKIEIGKWQSKCEKVYDSLEKWKNYAKELEKKEEIPEGMVSISEHELNGYEKAVRIVRNRAIQQIDKAKADEHGYTLLRADLRKYNPKSGRAWLITRSTPYSVQISLEDVSAVIERDLKDFYGFRHLSVINRDRNYGTVKTSVKEMLQLYERFYINGEDVSTVKNEEWLRTIDWLDKTNGRVSFEISRIAQNHGSGCYEVSYWATAPM